MGQSILVDVLQQPITTILGLILTAIWLLLHHKHLGYTEVGMSYDTIIGGNHWWRCFTSQLSHVEPLHLIFNLSALWSIGVVEHVGKLYYIQTTILLLILSPLITLLIYHLAIKYAQKESYRTVTAVGYSAVLFGWMTVLAVAQPGGIKVLPIFGFANLPMFLAPFGSLILTSLLFPRASFVGHLAGILAGYVIGFGLLSWMPWWSVFGLGGAVAGALVANYSRLHGGVVLPTVQIGGGELNVPFLSAWLGQQHGGNDVEEGGRS